MRGWAGAGLVGLVGRCLLPDTRGELTPWVRVVTISDTASRKRGSGHQCVPGEGMVPLVDRLKSLCAAGYAGPIECRVLSADRDATGYDELLARCLASFDRLCSDVNG